MDTKQKYIRVRYGIIIFPESISHDTFKHLNPTSAGFCYILDNEVKCFGHSFSLGIKSEPKKDSFDATNQLFGFEAAFAIKNEEAENR